MNGTFSWRMLVAVMALVTFTAVADDTLTRLPLPNPLTLEQALALADEPHPDLDFARADLALAQARQLETGARYSTRAYLDITSETVEPSTGGGHIDDSRARVLVNRPIYDFGDTRALTASADASVASRELHVLDARQQRRIEIMQRFHDVILADLRYTVDLEEMTHRYLNFNRLRERRTLGQVSDLDVLEAENPYQEALIRRTASQQEQLAARQRLALALNRPDEIPNELITPKLSPMEREIPNFKAVYESATTASPEILALRKEVESALAGLDAARAQHGPTLTAELEFGKYQRALAARSDVRAGLTLRMPLVQGDDSRAAVARAQAELAVRQARLLKVEYQLRQTALELVQRLVTLKVERSTAQQRLALRELSLDRQRALYEMEVQTRLGDALTRLTEAQWLAVKVDLDILLTWARIDALSGKPIFNALSM